MSILIPRNQLPGISLWMWLLVICSSFTLSISARADDVLLKNGLLLKGRASRIPGLTNELAKRLYKTPDDPDFIIPDSPPPYWMLDDSVRRYYFFNSSVEKAEAISQLGSTLSYQIKHERKGRENGFAMIGSTIKTEPFDEFGRRTITIQSIRGEVPVVQAISEIRVDFCTIESLQYKWDYKVDTSTIPVHVLKSLIDANSNRLDAQERRAAVQFYVQIQEYETAMQELLDFRQEFSDQQMWCDDFERRVKELIAMRAMSEVERRKLAGQHQLAMYYARQLPPADVTADVLQRSHDLLEDYDEAVQDRDRIVMLLDELQATLPVQFSSRLSSMKSTLEAELQYELMSRLQPFLSASEDSTMPPAEKLALAYSGWVLGAEKAIVNLEEAVRLWDARFFVLEYLRTDPMNLERSAEIIKSLGDLESISIQRVETMLPNLPLPFPTAPPAAGVPAVYEIPQLPTEKGFGVPVKYTAIFPPEYNQAHQYPVLVVMRAAGQSFESAAKIWAGDSQVQGLAQRKGYIVIAPHFNPDTDLLYRGSEEVHHAVMESVTHLQKHFRVDANRIAITGHGLGADACIDLAISRSDVFSAAIPFGGLFGTIHRVAWKNAPTMSWYLVMGERDRLLFEKNASAIHEMLKRRQSVLCCVYLERGFEIYAEEQERIFNWLAAQKRAPLSDVAKWEAGVYRNYDRHFQWLEIDGVAASLYPVINWNSPEDKLPPFRPYEGSMSKGGGITVSHQGQRRTIWLSPELFDFSQRAVVRVNLKVVYRDFVRPSIEDMLDAVRDRGDRQRLYWARLKL